MSESVKQYKNQGMPSSRDRDSQLSAIRLLIKLGYEYLTPEQLASERQGKMGNVLLENILREQLQTLNSIHHKGHSVLFSDYNIQTAITKLKTIKFDGLQKTSEAIFDLLTLGASLSQTVDGDMRNFNLSYIDWHKPERNRFHIAANFMLERTRSSVTESVDIVLFVNGIPLVVIACVTPEHELDSAIKLMLRQQESDCIPHLFPFCQLLIGTNRNSACYATAGTPQNFWARWHDLQDRDEDLMSVVHQPVDKQTETQLLNSGLSMSAEAIEPGALSNERGMSQQDKTLYSLCRPERLLELAFKFTVFENGIKKIARYQQYFVIKSTLERIRQYDSKGCRKGGMIWHTQGSGKSLTMVMLVRNLLLQRDIPHPRIVLVSDRNDLDRQLANTFAACGLAPQRATSGRHLLELVSELKAGIVTTLIQKFDKAMNVKKYQDESTDIFMLVDESHRSNFGIFAARMRQMFSNACYLGFTGTPLLKKEKNNFARFGGLIEPHYSINQAIQDKAVVPLLYEGRHTELKLDKTGIDAWFEQHTQGLSPEQVLVQKSELQKKFASASTLNRAEQTIYMRALDISDHYRKTWQGTGFKAQLVAPDKETALLYHKSLQAIGQVSSEVVISAPDEREGQDDTERKPAASVVAFWQTMMQHYGNKEEYEKQIINQYRNGDTPEILIVVSKLLTGFDAPCNTVLYLCATLKEHTLLQAVARVNRIYENKDFGFIVDYVNALGELDKALNMYSAFAGFDAEDIIGTLTSVDDEVAKLPGVWTTLWDIFRDLENESSEELWDQRLANQTTREDFYQRLNDYSKTLAIALSSEQFISQTDADTVMRYKDDLQRFYQLKYRAKRHFPEGQDPRDYQPKIKKMLDTYLRTDKIVPINRPVNLFEEQSYNIIREENESYPKDSPSVRAAFMVQAAKLAITKKKQQEPVIYQEFSDSIENIINKHRDKRISDLEYLDMVLAITDELATRRQQSKPELYLEQERALTIYKAIKPIFNELAIPVGRLEQIATDTALTIQSILQTHWKINFWDDIDAQNRVTNGIDDFLYDVLKDRYQLELTVQQKDDVIELAMGVAKPRLS